MTNYLFSELLLKNHWSFWARLNQSWSFYYKKIFFSELQLKKIDHFEHDFDWERQILIV